MNELVVFVWAAVLVALWVALVTSPRWFFRSLGRHRLWELHDSLNDDIREGFLPQHPAVLGLRRKVGVAISDVTKMRLLDALIFRRLRAGLSPEAIALLDAEPSDEGLGEKERQRLREHEHRFELLLMASLLLGSWTGLAIILERYVQESVRSRGRVSPMRIVESVAESALGRKTREGAEEATHCFAGFSRS